jgi:hypothetical protein
MIQITFTFIGSAGYRIDLFPVEWSYYAIPSLGDYIRLSNIVDVRYLDDKDFELVENNGWEVNDIEWTGPGKVTIGLFR